MSFKHLEDLCIRKKKETRTEQQKANQNNTHDSAADEAAVTDAADDAASASSAGFFPAALQAVDQRVEEDGAEFSAICKSYFRVADGSSTLKAQGFSFGVFGG